DAEARQRKELREHLAVVVEVVDDEHERPVLLSFAGARRHAVPPTDRISLAPPFAQAHSSVRPSVRAASTRSRRPATSSQSTGFWRTASNAADSIIARASRSVRPVHAKIAAFDVAGSAR